MKKLLTAIIVLCIVWAMALASLGLATWEDPVIEYTYTQEEVEALAQLLYGEALNCTVEGQAGVIWCVLNRVDDPRFPDTILGVITQYNQFFGYRKSNPVLRELTILAEDVLRRYYAEHGGIEDVGRVLPKEYVFFSGDGKANYFTITYASTDVWDWSLYNPYTE